MDFSKHREVNDLLLGGVFIYILSNEWGNNPEPKSNEISLDIDRNEDNENDHD